MSTTAIVILVAIGLVIMMRLNDRSGDQDSTPPDKGSSLAGYLAATGVVVGITVLLVRACQGSF